MKKIITITLIGLLNLSFANELQKMDVPQNYGQIVKFGGVINQKPTDKLGSWKIGEISILTDNRTNFKGLGGFEIGKYVEVRGFRNGKQIIATEIESY